jgi:hypothetical protein
MILFVGGWGGGRREIAKAYVHSTLIDDWSMPDLLACVSSFAPGLNTTRGQTSWFSFIDMSPFYIETARYLVVYRKSIMD